MKNVKKLKENLESLDCSQAHKESLDLLFNAFMESSLSDHTGKRNDVYLFYKTVRKHL